MMQILPIGVWMVRSTMGYQRHLAATSRNVLPFVWCLKFKPRWSGYHLLHTEFCQIGVPSGVLAFSWRILRPFGIRGSWPNYKPCSDCCWLPCSKVTDPQRRICDQPAPHRMFEVSRILPYPDRLHTARKLVGTSDVPLLGVCCSPHQVRLCFQESSCWKQQDQQDPVEQDTYGTGPVTLAVT